MSKYILRAILIATIATLPLTGCETSDPDYFVEDFGTGVGSVFDAGAQTTGGAINQIGEWGQAGFEGVTGAVQQTGEAIGGAF